VEEPAALDGVGLTMIGSLGPTYPSQTQMNPILFI